MTTDRESLGDPGKAAYKMSPDTQPTTHEVKCWAEFFRHVIDGSKTFEVRKDDRGYREGDRLVLREYDPATNTYTGRSTKARIGYVLRNHCAAIPNFAGHVVFSLHDVSPVQRGLPYDY